MNKYMLLYKNKIVVSKGNSHCDERYIATIISNIASLGYTLSPELIEILKTNSEKFVVDFYKKLVVKIKDEIGFKRYKPLYTNFPEQLIELSDYRLFIDAIIHYITKGERLPYYEEEERFPLVDTVKYTVLQLGSVEDYKINFANILQSKTSISDRNKEYITWFINSHTHLALEALPENIPLKENVCMAVSLFAEKGIYSEEIGKYVKTATDVLRMLTFISGGDISLARKGKCKAFTRKERKFILGMLEEMPYKLEDMNRYRNYWVSAGEKLHPGDFALKYPSTFRAFTKLREKGSIETFNSKVIRFIEEGDFKKAVNLLKIRPGELARKLNEMLMLFGGESNYILKAFQETAGRVETTVLWQVREFFIHRDEDKLRAFFPKGNISKMYVKENTMKPIDNNICRKVISICEDALEEKYKEKEPLGNVYIAKELKKYIIPFNQRSASRALKTITRGSKVAISDETNVIRAFIHWKDCPGSYGTDVDLTACLMREDFSRVLDIGYYNLVEEKIKCCHSGDVRFAPMGGSEFIDIDIESALEAGIRYAVFTVNSYSEENFIDIPECFFGFMERQAVKSGEVYEPRTVKNKFDLTSLSKMAVTMIFDLKEREFIFVDSSFKAKAALPNNVICNLAGVNAFAKIMTELHKPNMYDLFYINGKARGTVVQNIEEADTRFVLEKSEEDIEGVNEITPYDIEEIIGNYL